MREIGDVNILKEFCEKFCSIVDRHCKYIIVSGYLAIASGRSRATQDIDMIIPKIQKHAFVALHKDLVKGGFNCVQGENPEEIYDFYLVENTSIRYLYGNEFLPEMEVKLAKDLLDNIQIQTRVKIPLTNVDVWFGSVEMNIAFKEEYLKSEKDMEDARHLRIVFKEEINEQNINKLKKTIREVRLS